MMRHIKKSAASVLMLLVPLLFHSTASGKTIYSVGFDYRKAVPSSVYFAGKSHKEVDRLCETGEHASTADVAACSQRDYEIIFAKLRSKIKSLEDGFKKDDAELKAEDNPIASPYFEKGQNAWIEFRDNQCYAETYSLGEALMRYMTFWDCMARITKERLDDLDSAKD
ncbi:lysozyme inhibitor LprI family protein [Paraburkholderia phytofirmans]|uniref:DUF1311 domain-containing protein n=1 Tax=Paraburkholderia phytofirmans TaxID=261302 RepID=A0ABW9BKV6_9BURK